tara:strand:+ start:6360 stop:7526 length:1167 start_codon:yes stop_codon:yes gene_type:complete
MAEFQVKSLDDTTEKSQQEVEASLLKVDQEKVTPTETNKVVVNDTTNEVKVESEPVETETETGTTDQVEENVTEDVPETINENSVLSYINEKYNREVNSIDELFTTEEKESTLPEDVESFLKYKKETGRGLDDYVKLNQNYDEADPDKLLAEYWRVTKPHLDEEDIAFEMDNNFGFDPDYDDEKDGKKRTIAKKQELSKAKEYFNDLKKEYNVPVESAGTGLSEDEKKNYEAYKKYSEESKTQQDITHKRREYFASETDKLFSEDFKGFEFSLGEKDLTYKPASVDQLKQSQSSLEGFVNKHINKDGFVNNVGEYHRSLAVALNPEGFAKFFYDQGKSDAIDNVTKETKNINMSDVRSSPESSSTGGFKVTNLSNEKLGSRLLIKSNK